ncbi:DUF998 domain-containing protein [Tessaracoccus antarcticus]|uniref:DUF998 domain-containing protein n=1 Tax=Tessaracoccus antarcticus TaxID=2479848 RepID=A0A3M0GMC5_9ACTN|nr:DUF998 domain-containing protein [Tessaracoccus antarcticus]RMB62339.1 DUF998 domain-containing protein [Tessaracoccus antarcticus]
MTVRYMSWRQRDLTDAPPQDTISAQGAAMSRPVAPAGGPSRGTGRASHQLVVSFLTQGRAIAVLGFFLPVSMLAFSLMTGTSIRGSLSEYYYTPVRDLMVGTLIAMAVFLWSYRGFSNRDDDLRYDRVVGKIAAVAAGIIAFSPITPRNDDRCTLVQCIIGPQSAAFIHGGGAMVFFLCLAVFCIVLLPRSAVESEGARGRIGLYLTSGGIIVAASVFIGIWQFLPVETIFAMGRYRPVFFAETVAIFAFSTAWLVRGNALEAAITASQELSRRDGPPADP